MRTSDFRNSWASYTQTDSRDGRAHRRLDASGVERAKGILRSTLDELPPEEPLALKTQGAVLVLTLLCENDLTAAGAAELFRERA